MPRFVKSGDRGPQVKALQQLLNSLLPAQQGRPPLKTDGIFGDKTTARVKEFQTLCKLKPDGIVGPLTNAKLLDIRESTLKAAVTPQPNANPPNGPSKPSKPPASSVISPPTGKSDASSSKLKMSVEAQFGRALQLPPLDVSPWALDGQFNIYVPGGGNVSAEISLGGQFTKNLATSPNGKWTGQAFLQIGPNGIKTTKFGPVDLFNPAVILFAQRNDGKPFTGGLAIGNQTSIQLIGNDDSKLGVFWFLNLQTQIFNLQLDDSKFQVRSTQVFTGFRGEFEFFKQQHR